MRTNLLCLLSVVFLAGACRSGENPQYDLSPGKDASLPPTDFAGVDLTGVDLTTPPADLATADLSGADLAQADLAGTDLAAPDLAVPPADAGVGDGAVLPPDMTGVDLAYPPPFAAAKSYAVGGGPLALATGDVNADGHADLVVTNVNAPAAATPVSSTISVLLGVGDGTFGTQATFPVSAIPYSVALRDIDGDNKLDAVVCGSTGLDVLHGDGAGSFASILHVSAGNMTSSLRDCVVLDVNGDGRPDIAERDVGNASVLVYPGKVSGAGTTYTAATAVSFPVSTMAGRIPTALGSGDINGDGKVDLLSGNFISSSLSTFSTLLNTFTTAGAVPSFAASSAEVQTGSVPFFVGAYDLDGANKLDIAVVNLASNTVGIYLSDSAVAGTVSFAAVASYAVGSGPQALTIADMDSDGFKDLVVISLNTSTVSVLYGDGSGVFGVPNAKRLGTETVTVGTSPSDLVQGTFNADAKIDIATVNQDSNDVSVLINRR